MNHITKKRTAAASFSTLILSLAFCAGAKESSVAAQALMIITTVQKYHYSPRPVDHRFSETVFETFFHTLDPQAMLFTEETISQLDTFKLSIDDEVRQKKTAFLDAATSLYARQLRVADSLVRGLRKKEIDLTVADTLRIGGDAVYGKERFLAGKWAQWMKYRVLMSFSGEGDSAAAAPPPQKDICRMLDSAVSRETRRLQSKMNPVGGIRAYTGNAYLQAISTAFDPHSLYLSAGDKSKYETAVSKESSSFGIVLKLTTAGEFEIARLAPGGPAWRSNRINEGDVVLDIRNPAGTAIDLRCASLADVEKFLGSCSGQATSFRVRKKNGTIVTVSLRKEMLDVEENTVRGYVLRAARSIGYLYLPSFYADLAGDSYSMGCANDVAKELIRLKNAAIDGLILDLRFNGGGSIEEALRIAGGFIDYGALCITHSRGKAPETIKDNAKGTIYGGPLVVLVNSTSASASELLAGVLQDYHRALIVGSRTFGKCSFQQILPVDAGDFDSLSHYKGDPPAYLTLTTGCSYRVTGESIQKTGVVPDIELPDLLKNAATRESSYRDALEFGKINKKTYYYPCPPLPVAALKSMSDARLKVSPAFASMEKAAALIHDDYSGHPVPLTFQSFARNLTRFEELDDTVSAGKCPFAAVSADAAGGTARTTAQDSADVESALRDIRKDIYIHEAFKIVNDLITISANKEAR